MPYYACPDSRNWPQVPELQAALRRAGRPVSGRKEALVQRLRQALVTAAVTTAADPATTTTAQSCQAHHCCVAPDAVAVTAAGSCTAADSCTAAGTGADSTGTAAVTAGAGGTSSSWEGASDGFLSGREPMQSADIPEVGSAEGQAAAACSSNGSHGSQHAGARLVVTSDAPQAQEVLAATDHGGKAYQLVYQLQPWPMPLAAEQAELSDEAAAGQTVFTSPNDPDHPDIGATVPPYQPPAAQRLGTTTTSRPHLPAFDVQGQSTAPALGTSAACEQRGPGAGVSAEAVLAAARAQAQQVATARALCSTRCTQVRGAQGACAHVCTKVQVGGLGDIRVPNCCCNRCCCCLPYSRPIHPRADQSRHSSFCLYQCC